MSVLTHPSVLYACHCVHSFVPPITLSYTVCHHSYHLLIFEKEKQTTTNCWNYYCVLHCVSEKVCRVSLCTRKKKGCFLGLAWMLLEVVQLKTLWCQTYIAGLVCGVCSVKVVRYFGWIWQSTNCQTDSQFAFIEAVSLSLHNSVILPTTVQRAPQSSYEKITTAPNFKYQSLSGNWFTIWAVQYTIANHWAFIYRHI